MNKDTHNLIERPYQEIVDDILTAIIGGVVNEPILYDIKEDFYNLSQIATNIRGITGTRTLLQNGSSLPLRYSFQKEVDFEFDEIRNAVIWQSDGKKPDDESVFYVDYIRRDSKSPLTDINIGSVTRTLSESIGREIAIVYQQINQAYLAGFLDTAESEALERVISILGVKRRGKEYARGLVSFFRDPAVGDGNITIPENTELKTSKGEAVFITSELRTLQRGQLRIDLPVRAADVSKGTLGVVVAGAINILSQPIAGIGRVTNLDATVLGTEGESDEQLRARARATLRGLGKGTLAALRRVIIENQANLTEVWEPNSEISNLTLPKASPGTLTLMVDCKPEQYDNLKQVIQETRAAGIHTTILARQVFVKLKILAKLTSLPSTSEGKIKLVYEMITEMQKYVSGLGSGRAATGEGFLKALKNIKELGQDTGMPRILDVMAWQSDIGQQNADILTEALIEKLRTINPNDDKTFREAVTNVLKDDSPLVPTERRKPNRDLIQGAGGSRATDDDFDTGNFTVTLPAEDWFIVLDILPSDISLQAA